MLASVGGLLGILVAVALGYGLYRGAVHINLARFFKATTVVLVLVAAGLVTSSLHAAHGAGWINFWQQPVIDPGRAAYRHARVATAADADRSCRVGAVRGRGGTVCLLATRGAGASPDELGGREGSRTELTRASVDS